MPLPKKPSDLLVVNGWYLEIPGIESPHFETMEGMAKTSGSVGIVDGGANVEYLFPSQIVRNGQLSFTRTYQGTAADTLLEQMADAMMHGMMINGAAVKMHQNKEVFRLLLEGFRFTGYKYPTWDVNGEEKFTVVFEATVHKWTKL